ncbi:trihelix transcription factor DF1-like [Gastrolobium bilobum]|uniref:trihelix transcription factor DF1-like n=1 Tax=Gastrolobium bilobum TaxID=150636 RepID=UPI002AB2DF92|nr:trihelix transcription factor DF1-like [Gastrolobium bilobum]
MQLGDSSVLEISSPNKPVMAVTAAAPSEAPAHEDVNGGDMVEMEVSANSGEEKRREEGDKVRFGGNRWPRQETLALLKIRSDMDAVFRDSSLKGPLWEEVSRKLAELGYHRSAKKCKEKFENVYKYNKRTKESRSGKSDGKTYRFFDQLQALENQFKVSYSPKSHPVLAKTNTLAVTLPTRQSDNSTIPISYVTTTFPSTNPTLISPSPPTTTTRSTTITNPKNPSPQANNNTPHYSFHNMNLFSTITSSSTASDEDIEERYKRKRKWKGYFRRLTRQVLSKQEETQKKFLEAIDKREREWLTQQEAWRMQEIARINREHEFLVQERSNTAAKDSAIIALLQKLSGQKNPTQPPRSNSLLQQPPPQPSPSQSPRQVSQIEQQQQQPQPLSLIPNNKFEIQIMNNGYNATTQVNSSSRWPKAEIHALIRLRTSLEAKYEENGPKAPLWEDISAGMLRLGYNRSAKRCKEKWENINKYFKKVKESNKERREDSKTCPYFHELDAIYKEKSKSQNPFSIAIHMKPNELTEPLMVQPEQQWRPPLEAGIAKENASQYQENEKEEEEEDDVDEDENGARSVEEGGASGYDIVTNKLSSMGTVE